VRKQQNKFIKNMKQVSIDLFLTGIVLIFMIESSKSGK